MRVLFLACALGVACGGVSSSERGSGASGGNGSGGDAAAGKSGGGSPGTGGLCPGTLALDPQQTACALGTFCDNRPCVDPRPATADPFGGCFVLYRPRCAEDSECDPPLVCAGLPDCDKTCAEPCTAESCGDHQECDATGHCQPLSCTVNYACPAGTICAPARSFVPGATYESRDPHGCSPASCVDDGFTCPAGTLCDPTLGSDLHGCNPAHCDQGGSCPLNQRCDPTSATLDHCVGLACRADADCDCGLCLSGFCQTQPGFCGAVLL